MIFRAVSVAFCHGSVSCVTHVLSFNNVHHSRRRLALDLHRRSSSPGLFKFTQLFDSIFCLVIVIAFIFHFYFLCFINSFFGYCFPPIFLIVLRRIFLGEGAGFHDLQYMFYQDFSFLCFFNYLRSLFLFRYCSCQRSWNRPSYMSGLPHGVLAFSKQTTVPLRMSWTSIYVNFVLRARARSNLSTRYISWIFHLWGEQQILLSECTRNHEVKLFLPEHLG